MSDQVWAPANMRSCCLKMTGLDVYHAILSRRCLLQCRAVTVGCAAAIGDATAIALLLRYDHANQPPALLCCPSSTPPRLKLQLEDQQGEAAEALRQQADSMAARLEAAATAAAEQAVQRWAAEALPPLLQPMQEAVAATADLAASVAAEVAGLAGKVGQLADRCGQLEAAHANHEQRLGLAEECSLEASAGSGPASLQQLEALGQQVQSLQEGHARLDEAVQGLRQQAAAAAHQAAAAAQQAAAVAASPQPPTSWQSFPTAALSPEMEAAAAELPSLRRQVAALADQQAQQAGSAEVLQSGERGLMVVARRQSGCTLATAGAWLLPDHHLNTGVVPWQVTWHWHCAALTPDAAAALPPHPPTEFTDVAALARHTRALDRDVRGLRAKCQHTEEALLQSSAAFSKALKLPSPVGPFTSFPPQL